MSSRIVFNESRHRYSLDGKYVPGVTTVLNKAIGKPALINWSAKLAAQWAATNREAFEILGEENWIQTATAASIRARDEAMRNGTLLHLLAESLVYGDELPAEDPQGLPWPDEIYRSAEQLARFYDAWRVIPVRHEAVVFHSEHRWAGKLDLIADLGSSQERWLLDYKTGASGVWPEATLQANAYANATHIQNGEKDEPMIRVERLGAVWLRPDSWQLHPLRYDPELYTVFGHAMRVAAWTSERADTNVLAPLPIPSKEATA